MRPLADIVKSNQEAAKLGIGIPGAIGTKPGPGAKPEARLTPERLQKLGLDQY